MAFIYSMYAELYAQAAFSKQGSGSAAAKNKVGGGSKNAKITAAILLFMGNYFFIFEDSSSALVSGKFILDNKALRSGVVNLANAGYFCLITSTSPRYCFIFSMQLTNDSLPDVSENNSLRSLIDV